MNPKVILTMLNNEMPSVEVVNAKSHVEINEIAQRAKRELRNYQAYLNDH